jgi:hypothetical protein
MITYESILGTWYIKISKNGKTAGLRVNHKPTLADIEAVKHSLCDHSLRSN